MKRLGLKNFRRFEELEPIELSNINILVGPNNSGKSTFVKAMVLVLNYLQSENPWKFDFKNIALDDLGIGSFAKAKKIDSKSSEIHIEFRLDAFAFEFDIVQNTASPSHGDVSNLTIRNSELGLEVQVSKEKVGTEEVLEFTVSNTRNVRLDENKHRIKKLQEAKNALEKNRPSEDDCSEDAVLELYDRFDTVYDKISAFETEIESLTEIANSIDDRNESAYRLSFRQRDKTLSLKSGHGQSQKTQVVHPRSFSGQKSDLSISSLPDGFNKISHIATYFQQIALNIERSDMFSNVLEEFQNPIRMFSQDKRISEFFQSLEFETSVHGWFYVGMTAIERTSVYSSAGTKSRMGTILHKFHTSGSNKDAAHTFVNNWLRKFEIGEGFKIDSFEGGEAYSVKIIDNGLSLNLADKGVGSSQLMMLLFQIGIVVRDSQQGYVMSGWNTVFVEESEMNLHPKLQSLLADMFYEVWKDYLIDFVLETHSEYLIRKSQLLVKKHNLVSKDSDNPFRVIYFPRDKEEAPYVMKYESNGKFDRPFGSGFFDVAGESTLELYRLNKNQN